MKDMVGKMKEMQKCMADMQKMIDDMCKSMSSDEKSDKAKAETMYDHKKEEKGGME